MKKKELIKYLLLLIFVFGVSYYIYTLPYEREAKKGITVDKYADTEALLVVSHYEDAILYASSILNDKDVLVVCITCQDDGVASQDLAKVLASSKDQHLFLGFSEYDGDNLDDWMLSYDKLEFEIDKILKLRHWNEIYTHHPKGEGQLQHKITSRIVTKNAIKERLSQNLNYFNTADLVLIEWDPASPAIVNKQAMIDMFTNKDEIREKMTNVSFGESFIDYDKYVKDEKLK